MRTRRRIKTVRQKEKKQRRSKELRTRRGIKTIRQKEKERSALPRTIIKV